MPAPAASPRPRGRRPRTDEERAVHRARLVDAAIEAVRRHGPDVAMVDIAAVAGVSKPVLYDEFGDKLGVADAIAVELAAGFERELLVQLGAGGTIDLAIAVDAIVEGLVQLIDGEPELYGFLARSVRTSERGLLDHALARVIRERAQVLFGLMAPRADSVELRIIVDGWFGFVVAALESWQRDDELARDRFVVLLSAVLRAGFAGAADVVGSD